MRVPNPLVWRRWLLRSRIYSRIAVES